MKMLLVVLMIVAMAFAITPAMAGQSIVVNSGVSGSVLSGNIGSGTSFAVQSSRNTTTAGYTATTCNIPGGQVKTITTFGSSVGSTQGFGYGSYGAVSGQQYGSFSVNK